MCGAVGCVRDVGCVWEMWSVSVRAVGIVSGFVCVIGVYDCSKCVGGGYFIRNVAYF